MSATLAPAPAEPGAAPPPPPERQPLPRWVWALVVIGVWIVQVIGSRWWLSRWAFGPAEALLRAATYLRPPRFG